MKIIIDIPEEMYKNIKDGMWFGNSIIGYAIEHGTPLDEAKMDKITTYLHDFFIEGAGIITNLLEGSEKEKEETIGHLMDVISSLHNELYKAIKGEYYDYMFHWANLGYGGCPNDALFKEEGTE